MGVRQTKSLKLAGASGNQSVTFDSTPLAGSAVVVKIAHWSGNGSGPFTVSDNQGNTYGAAVASITANDKADIYCHLAHNVAASGTFTVTVASLPLSSWGHISIIEIDGAPTSGAFDVSATNSAASSTNPATCTSGTTATTAQADEVAIATMLIDGGTNGTGMALPSGYTNVFDEENGASFLPCRTDYKVLTATGAQSASWGSSINPTGASGRWSALIVTIKTSAAAATYAPPPVRHARNLANLISL